MKTSVKRLLFVGGIASIVFATAIIIFLSAGTTVDAVQNVVPVAHASSNPGLPIRLLIPSINIDAVIKPTGVLPDGAMGVPKGPTTVAWFDLGKRPGENGTAVIDGHSGWKDNIPAVFDNLYTLRTGDTIYVVNDTGATTTFVVRAVRIFRKNENAADVFHSTSGGAHLNLITCEGVWSKTQQSYSNRLIVFAVKE
ncbi:MAG: class F sortase [Minisyncoccota bacterium]